MSIHADDEFNLRLALDSELDDVTPRDGLADLVIARYRKGRRRRFAGVFGLFVVFAGIGVPIGIASTSGGTAARSGPVALRLGSYTLTLPDRYHLSDPDAALRRRDRRGDRSGTGAGSGARQEAAAVASGVCVLMVLTPAVSAGQAVPRDAKQVTVGRYRAWLAPPGYAPSGDGPALVIAADDQDLVIGASGLSRSALVSLVSAGLSAA